MDNLKTSKIFSRGLRLTRRLDHFVYFKIHLCDLWARPRAKSGRLPGESAAAAGDGHYTAEGVATEAPCAFSKIGALSIMSL